MSLTHDTHTLSLSNLQHEVRYKRVGIQVGKVEIDVRKVGEESLEVVQALVYHGGVGVTEADSAPLEDQVQVAQRLFLHAVDALKVGTRVVCQSTTCGYPAR